MKCLIKSYFRKKSDKVIKWGLVNKFFRVLCVMKRSYARKQ